MLNLLEQFRELVVVQNHCVRDHEVDEEWDFVLDDIERGVWPEETWGKADGKVCGAHLIAVLEEGDVMEEGEEVMEEDLIALGELHEHFAVVRGRE